MTKQIESVQISKDITHLLRAITSQWISSKSLKLHSTAPSTQNLPKISSIVSVDELILIKHNTIQIRLNLNKQQLHIIHRGNNQIKSNVNSKQSLISISSRDKSTANLHG